MIQAQSDDNHQSEQTGRKDLIRSESSRVQMDFPMIQFEFSPTLLSLTNDDFIHIQWESSNSQ